MELWAWVDPDDPAGGGVIEAPGTAAAAYAAMDATTSVRVVVAPATVPTDHPDFRLRVLRHPQAEYWTAIDLAAQTLSCSSGEVLSPEEQAAYLDFLEVERPLPAYTGKVT